MPRDLHLKPVPTHSWLRRAVCGGVAAAGLTTTLLSASPASADVNWFGDAGIRLGYTWGEGGGFIWGIEGRLGSAFGEARDLRCGYRLMPATAGTVRFEAMGLERPRLGVGLQTGAIAGPFSLLADLGLGHRWGEHGGLSLPIGFEMQVSAVDSFVNFDTTLGDGALGGGFHLPAPDRGGNCAVLVAGRALHDAHGRAALPAMRACSPVGGGSELESAVVGEWAERARAEWASVPAFLQLADQLDRAGAPRPLVEGALKAADDELRHAILSARVAVGATGSAMALARVTSDTRVPAEGRAALVRLATESWLDGCLGEGRAAATANYEAQVARYDALRTVQATISRDEARHAELAWDVLAWAIERGGDDVRHAVSALHHVDPVESSTSDTCPDLTAFGLLPADEQRRIGEAIGSSARTRLKDLLAT